MLNPPQQNVLRTAKRICNRFSRVLRMMSYRFNQLHSKSVKCPICASMMHESFQVVCATTPTARIYAPRVASLPRTLGQTLEQTLNSWQVLFGDRCCASWLVVWQVLCSKRHGKRQWFVGMACAGACMAGAVASMAGAAAP